MKKKLSLLLLALASIIPSFAARDWRGTGHLYRERDYGKCVQECENISQ